MNNEPRVDLLSMTENPSELIYAAFRQCYYSGFIGDDWHEILNHDVSYDKQRQLIEKVVKSGHETPLEHVNFTFGIDNVSRSLTHQLVRHRIASYSQQSQRFVGEGEFNYIIPPSIEDIPEAKELYVGFMNYSIKKYRELKEILESHGRKKAAKEDARFVFTNATTSRIVVSMNARSLLNFFELRTCTRSQWEIRSLANRMLEICRNEVPVIFNSSGPRCLKYGYCPEEKGCGWMPSFQELVSGR